MSVLYVSLVYCNAACTNLHYATSCLSCKGQLGDLQRSRLVRRNLQPPATTDAWRS